jgi:hypothetical protein
MEQYVAPSHNGNQSHEDATYMNISSIQISLCGNVILQLLLQLNNVVALII